MADETDRVMEALQIGRADDEVAPEAVAAAPEPTSAAPVAPVAAPSVVYQFGPQPAAKAPRAVKAPPPVRPASLLDRLFPAQDERVVVYRKRPDGPPDGTYVGTYQASDLVGCVTIEQFLERHVRPRLADGYGDYVVKTVDATGLVRKSGFFSLEAPLDANARKQLRDPLLETAADLLRDLAQRNGNSNGVSAAQVEELRRALSGSSVSPDVRLILDKLDGIARGMQPKEENVERVLLLKLLKKVEDMGAVPMSGSSLPPLSAASSADPGQIARDVAREVADAIGRNQPSLVDLIGAIQKLNPAPVAAVAPPDAIAQLTSIITLVEKMGANKEVDYLRQKLDRVEQLLTQPSEQPSPIETIQQVVQVAESLEKLGERRVTRTGPGTFGSYVRDIFSGIPDVAREIGTLVDKAKAREVATARRIMLERAPRPRSAPTPRSAPKAPEVPEGPKAPEAPEENEDPYGPDFAPLLAAVVVATDDRARIKATLVAFRHLGKDVPWKPFYARTVQLAKKRDREAIKFVAALLDNLRETGKLPVEQRDAIVSAFESNWDAIVDRVFGTAAN